MSAIGIDAGGNGLQGVHQFGVLANADVRFMSESTRCSFSVECACGSRFFSAFLVFDGTKIRGESMVAPFFSSTVA